MFDGAELGDNNVCLGGADGELVTTTTLLDGLRDRFNGAVVGFEDGFAEIPIRTGFRDGKLEG